MAPKPQQLEIRVLSESDAAEFWKLRLRALREEPTFFGASHEESAETPLEEVARKLRCSDDSFVLGALVPHLVGTLGFRRRQGQKRRHQGVIWGMYVAPECRGLGLGRSLMQAASQR